MNMMNTIEIIKMKAHRMTFDQAEANVDTRICNSGASGPWDLKNLSIQPSVGPDSLTVNSCTPVADMPNSSITVRG